MSVSGGVQQTELESPIYSDRWYVILTNSAAVSMVGLLIGLLLVLLVTAWPSIVKSGVGFVLNSDWDPVKLNFGSFPYIFGTLVTSVIAVLFAYPLAVSSAICVVRMLPQWLGRLVAFFIELLAAIPSVVYGVWGIFVLVPFMRTVVDPFLIRTFSGVPVLGALFPQGMTIGANLLTAGVILTFMIIPTIMSVSRAVIAQVPPNEIEAYKVLGATEWEIIRHVVWPHSRQGIIAATMLGLARALGETMAVTMVIGNSYMHSGLSLMAPGYSLASAIANQFSETDSVMYAAAVVELGLVLLVIDSIIGMGATYLIRRAKRRAQAYA